jgi:5-methyltetrahydrofolate corrinoid/iron sulfur protein methyltransferase
LLIVGECIHVISKEVKTALENRDKEFLQALALRQVEKGAAVIDLNIGPQKKSGPEVMSWAVNTVQEVTDAALSLDTTNAAAIEAGLGLAKKKAFINSTDATAERLEALMPLAAKYKANIVALTYSGGGLPTTADARIELAAERILPAAAELGIPEEDIYLDPLVLTVNGNQDQGLPTIEAVRFFKQMSDPPPKTICGLSNISNSCPAELRPLLNRVFLVMALGAGLDSAIVDPLDEELMAVLRLIDTQQATTPQDRLYLDLYQAYAAGAEFDSSGIDMNVPELRDIVKTVLVLENKTLYAHGYLKT